MTAMKTRPAEADAETDGAPKKSKKKLIIIVLVVLLVVGGGAYKFLAPKPKPAPPKAGETVKMDPTILNLADSHYLKVGISIQLVAGKAKSADFDSSQAGQLVINEFTGLDRGTLTNTERQKLETDLTTKIKKAYPGEVYALYLNTFLVD
ncbi:flagellar basal body-associated FliL family protein [uncultured Jatrophihabitans sp.]|uniref:flagellar basal body-associated FliL family protein n=1 Tax=uncultured Jatrophihabitans sp. TaxID=1610747 RepID=UPI0035CB3019